jgi:nicotinamidase-related amidase
LQLSLRRQELSQDDGGHAYWRQIAEPGSYAVSQTALLLCDMWDQHWSRGATERVDAMVPRMNEVTSAARDCGVLIVHSPSDTMDFYEGTPARQRALDCPPVEPPDDADRDDPPLPVDASDHGSDTGETETHKAWSRQHPGIDIDQDSDIISDDGRQVYSCLGEREITNLLIMGVHTNMCVLGRSFAIKQMVRWGMEVALIRDLTDTMYNPASPPYVSHDEGTRLVVEYIEKFWCPTVLSGDITS